MLEVNSGFTMALILSLAIKHHILTTVCYLYMAVPVIDTGVCLPTVRTHHSSVSNQVFPVVSTMQECLVTLVTGKHAAIVRIVRLHVSLIHAWEGGLIATHCTLKRTAQLLASRITYLIHL